MPKKAAQVDSTELKEKKVAKSKKVEEKVVEKKPAAKKKVAAKKEAKKVEKKEEVKEVVEKIEAPKEETPVLEAPKEKKKLLGKPTTMEELLESTGYTLQVPKPGAVLTGLVTELTKKMVLVDIGAKTEGMVVDREFEAAKDYIDTLAQGDEVSVFVVSPENERGQILLSLKRALVDRKWEQFAEFMQTDEAIKVRGLEVNKGGMIVASDGIRGFVPSSQFGKTYLGKMDLLLDKEFKVKVIEVDKEKNRLIFSERLVSEAEEIAMKSEALKHVTSGDIYEGVVSGIMPFGVFVGVEVPIQDDDEGMGKVEGLVHISEISWEKVNDPNDYFKLGDRVKVKVLGIDEGAGKLNLSVKQMSDDPWQTVETNYPVGAKVTGKVSRTAPFGAFVTLAPGVDGLIHISKIPSGNEPKVNEEIEVFVEHIDKDQRRMSLGMVLTEVPVGYK